MKSGLPKKDVSETELEILIQLWDRGQASTREITEAIYDAPLDPQFATVQKLLSRLEKKGYVLSDRRKRPHQYRAKASKDAFLVRGIESLADKLCGGSLSPILTSLVHSKKLTSSDVRSLEALIAELEGQKASRKPRDSQ